MIAEIFRSYMLLLLNSEVPENKKLIISRDALEVSDRLLERLDKDSEDTIFWNKLRLLKVIANQHNQGIKSDYSLDKLFNENSKFHKFKDEVYQLKSTIIDEKERSYIENQLILEKQFLASEEYISKFKHYIDKIENREFEDIADIQSELKDIIENLYMGFIRETNLAQSLEGVKIIDYNDPDSIVVEII